MAMIELAQPTQEGFAVPIHHSYRQIADDLAERIKAGEYADGEKLPSISNLAQLYSVGTTTARDAYRELKAQGLAEGIPGKGVFVRLAK